MIRSAQLARPFGARLTFVLLSLVAALLVTTGGSGTAAAAVTSGDYTYYTTADLCKLTVSPHAVSAQAGTQKAFKATVTAIGPVPILADSVDATYSETFSACALKQLNALEGVTVKFTVVSGPNAGKTADVALDSKGSAQFEITSAVPGVDVVKADLTLPDVCYSQYNGPQEKVAQQLPAQNLPAPCVQFTQIQPASVQSCGGPQVSAIVGDCPSVTLTDSGQVTWSAPQVVAQAADPSLSIAKFKRCVSHQFKIAPVYSGGTIASSTLFIDGKKRQTQNSSAAFTVNGRKYSAGKHNFEVVTVYTNGKAASKFGSFTRCAARVTVKRVSPKFTG